MNKRGVLSTAVVAGTLLSSASWCTYCRAVRVGPLHRGQAGRSDRSGALLKEVQSDAENVGRVRALIAAGADLNKHDIVSGVLWWTPLEYSARLHHWKTVELLVKRGADVNPEGGFGDEHFMTPLMRCAQAGSPRLVRLLIKHAARVNARGYHDLTALMLAAGAGRAGNVRVLLRHGADVNMRSFFGKKSALDFAIEEKHYDVVRLLRPRTRRWTLAVLGAAAGYAAESL